MLALIGNPEDLSLIVLLAPTPNRRPTLNRWAYEVASALLEPDSEEEWSFLRQCALNVYGDGWADSGAIQTLQLIASPKSLEILKEVERPNLKRPKSTARAVE